MWVELSKEFRFEAAHRLPRVPEGHKCARLHGHSFRAAVTVSGQVDPETGWLIDFGRLKELIEPHRLLLDHHYLNDVEGLDNPTSEHLARWLWRRLKPDLETLIAITIEETCTTRCVYRGEE